MSALLVCELLLFFLPSVLLVAGRYFIGCALRMPFRLTATTNPCSCLVYAAARVCVAGLTHYATQEVKEKSNSHTNSLEINDTTTSCITRNQNWILYQKLYLRKIVARFDPPHTAIWTLFDLQGTISNTHI
jgi:hypothetical protein